MARKAGALVLASALVLSLATLKVDAQGVGFNSKAIRAFSAALTAASQFGVPRYTTALLPTCNAANQGAVAYDTTANALTVCVPNAWASAGGASLTGLNTWTQLNTFSAGVTSGAGFNLTANGGALTLGAATNVANWIIFGTAQTPDTAQLTTGSTSNSWTVAESADFGFDFAHPLQTNPTMFFENAAQDSTQHTGVAYYGTQGKAIKTLTESAATSAIRIPVAAGAGVGGTIAFTVFASDSTDHQTLTGTLQYAAVAKLTVETCATPTAQGTPLNSVSAGTLTCTYACDTTPSNAVDIQFNCVSSLTQTTLEVWYRATALGSSEPLPQ